MPSGIEVTKQVSVPSRGIYFPNLIQSTTTAKRNKSVSVPSRGIYFPNKSLDLIMVV